MSGLDGQGWPTLPADGKCECAATGPDECVCGAWRDYARTHDEIRMAVNASCTCGGAGPGEGCPACEVYHHLFTANATLQGSPEAKRKEIP
jgi:hypothetical protein